MKVIWLCSVDIKAISKSDKGSVSGGWIYGAYNGISKLMDPSMTFCLPGKEKKHIVLDDKLDVYYYLETQDNISYFYEIIDRVNPDIIHIFGTEYQFAYDMLLASDKARLLNRTVVSIQGLISLISEHYTTGLPSSVIHGWTFRDFLRRDNIYFKKRSFVNRGRIECNSLKMTKHVIGRTTFDFAGSTQINPNLVYHSCNEILRPIFYEKRWSINKCVRHTVFISQCSYTIKGLHILLKAMPIILKKFPDARIVTTGSSIFDSSLKRMLHRDSYSNYLVKLSNKLHIENKISFLGRLDEEEMCQAYLNAHVFVCCSTIENSPNSLGEAMMLGMPIVASYVGGIMDMLADKIEGYLYQGDAHYMLAYYICSLFENDDLAVSMGNNARKRALVTHDMIKNTESLVKIYDELINSK